tara:strand:+ start:671 stop:1492 length:822 start_codon:yes stop_codon:yes gene_type:complete
LVLLVCGFATVSAATGVRHRDANQVGKGTPAVKGSLGVHVDRVSLDAGYLGTNETAAEEAVEAPEAAEAPEASSEDDAEAPGSSAEAPESSAEAPESSAEAPESSSEAPGQSPDNATSDDYEPLVIISPSGAKPFNPKGNYLADQKILHDDRWGNRTGTPGRLYLGPQDPINTELSARRTEHGVLTPAETVVLPTLTPAAPVKLAKESEDAFASAPEPARGDDAEAPVAGPSADDAVEERDEDGEAPELAPEAEAEAHAAAEAPAAARGASVS